MELLISGWEGCYNPTEPVVDLEGCVDLFVQSLHLDFSDLFEPSQPVSYPENRRTRTNSAEFGSLVGSVDKSALLRVVDELLSETSAQSEDLLESEEQLLQQILELTHGENIPKVSAAIVSYLREREAQLPQHKGCSVSLAELPSVLRIPLVEVWLGFLLGEHPY